VTLTATLLLLQLQKGKLKAMYLEAHCTAKREVLCVVVPAQQALEA
jgi:hypothetical protein